MVKGVDNYKIKRADRTNSFATSVRESIQPQMPKGDGIGICIRIRMAGDRPHVVDPAPDHSGGRSTPPKLPEGWRECKAADGSIFYEGPLAKVSIHETFRADSAAAASMRC